MSFERLVGWGRAGTFVKPHLHRVVRAGLPIRSLVAIGHGVAVPSDLVYKPCRLTDCALYAAPRADPVPSMDVGLAWTKARAQTPAFFERKSFLEK